MINPLKNLKENSSLQKKIELEAKEKERSYLDKHYLEKVETMRKEHEDNLRKAQLTYEESIRTQETILKEQHRLRVLDIENGHKKENVEHSQKISNLKKELQESKNNFEKEIDKKVDDLDKEKADFKNKTTEELNKIQDIFVKEVRDLRSRLEEASNKLRSAQRGYFRYLKYALMSFQYIKELKAESEAWMQHSITYNQRMESMHSKFEAIDKFNEKSEPYIKELLHYNQETDDDIIEGVIAEFESFSASEESLKPEKRIEQGSVVSQDQDNLFGDEENLDADLAKRFFESTKNTKI